MDLSLLSVYPKKENTCKKGLLVVNWTQIHNQNLAAIVYRGLSRTLHLREKSQSSQASCTAFLLAELPLTRKVLVLYFD